MGFIRHALVWILLFVLLSLPTLPSLSKYWRLGRSGTQTVGVVQARTVHREVKYTFVSAGHTYSGSARSGMAGVPAYESLMEGDRIPVMYIGSDPDISVGGDPNVLLRNDLRSLVGLMGFSLLILLVIGLIARVSPGSKFRGIPKEVFLKWI